MPGPYDDLLTVHALPSLAANLRKVSERVVARWDQAVNRFLPDADDLTTRQVRDSIPRVLARIADALASDESGPTEVLYAESVAHGQTRYHQSFNLEELIVEYRLLRRICVEELRQATGGALTVTEVMAVDVGIDIALQQAVMAFVQHLCDPPDPRLVWPHHGKKGGEQGGGSPPSSS